MQVDEDGARRLQAILEQNRNTAAGLAEAFESAYLALTALKKELSGPAGLKNIFSSLNTGLSIPKLPGGMESGLSPLSGGALSPGSARMTVGADFAEAEAALADFRSRLESERPRLSVNTSGITSAVSSAVSSIRAMLSSVSVTVPVTARAQLDASGLSLSGGVTGAAGSAGNMVRMLGAGGRVASPTFAMIAEEGRAEYVIPTDNEARAVPLLRSLISELSDSARAALFPAGAGTVSAPGSVSHSVQAPVNIHVTASAAAPEAVARSIYDTAQRSLLKTLKGVFA